MNVKMAHIHATPMLFVYILNAAIHALAKIRIREMDIQERLHCKIIFSLTNTQLRRIKLSASTGCYIPVNECELGIDECSTDAFCYDTLESYGCICNDGYDGDGFSCDFIDECLDDPCHSDYDCMNTADGYQCIEKPYE